MTQEGQYTAHTIQYGNVEIIVYRPILTDDERKKREETVKRALVPIGKEMAQKGMI